MILPAHLAAGLLGFLAAGSCVYQVVALRAAMAWRRRPICAPCEGSVSVLVPVCGDDPDQAACFGAICAQEHPDYEALFGALDADDPGLASAALALRAAPVGRARIVAGARDQGMNRKVCILERMSAEARGAVIVLCDSDMRVTPDYLTRVTAPLSDTSVGLVTCLYRAGSAAGPASCGEALAIGTEFAPSVLAADCIEGLSYGFGATIALRRETLDRIGGFSVLRDEIADDYLLGNRVSRLGLRVVLSDYVAETMLGRQRFRDVWARRVRWARTIRAVRPVGAAGAVMTHTVPLSLLAAASALAAHATGVAAAEVIAGFALRLAVAWAIVAWCTRDHVALRLLGWLPVSDLVSICVWLAGFCSRTVTWRGRRYRLGDGGRLHAA